VKRTSRGFLLVFALLVLVLLFTLGLGFVGKQADTYRAASKTVDAAVAMECAMAGLEDARVKLMKNLRFPPPGDDDQVIFSYTEILFDLDETTPIGSYTVTIDRRWEADPYEILVVEVVALAGDPAEPPRARRRLSVEVDLSPTNRGFLGPAANRGRFMNFQDHGSL
jgi:hypothetical protein